MSAARHAYRLFMSHELVASEDALLEEVHPEDARIMGTDQFVATLASPPFRSRSTQTLQALAEQLCNQHQIPLDLIRSPSRQRRLTRLRVAIATQALDSRIASLREIAEYLGREANSLSELLCRHRR